MVHGTAKQLTTTPSSDSNCSTRCASTRNRICTTKSATSVVWVRSHVYPDYNLNLSPSPARTISTCPTYTQSHVYACAQYCFNRGDDDASQSINMNIIHNHLNYHNYTGKINKTQSHMEFKSIIYQLMSICFGILKFQSTFYNSNFPFYNTGTRTNARNTIDTRPPSFPLTPLSIFIFNL